MKRRISIVVLYIFFFLCFSFVVNDYNIFPMAFLYFGFGCIALFFYNRKKSLFLSLINYFFTFYEFMVLLLISNKDWRHSFLDYDYRSKTVFVILLFSAPTILYVADAIFHKTKSK